MKLHYLFVAATPLVYAIPSFAQDVRPVGLSRPSVESRLPSSPQIPSPRELPDLSSIVNLKKEPEVAQGPALESAMKSFDPQQVLVRVESNRFQVWAGQVMLRDCGLDRSQADLVALTIRDNGFTLRGEIAGANPPFEYWLVETGDTDGKTKTEAASIERRLTKTIMLPLDARSIVVENISGAWCVRDSGRVLYNFGQHKDSAALAVTILKKYGFNALGIVGQPQPVMTLPIKAGVGLMQMPLSSSGKPSAFGEGAARFLSDGLFIPQVGYLGHRKPIEARKMQLARGLDWALVAGSETLLTFGTDETVARQVLKAFEDWRITEYVEVGEPAFRFYISSGQIPRGTPFNARTVTFRSKDVKIVKAADDHNWLYAGALPLVDVGKDETDANLMLAALKHFDVDSLVKFGSPRYGEYSFLVRSR